MPSPTSPARPGSLNAGAWIVGMGLVLLGACQAPAPDSMTEASNDTDVTLSVALQDGFEGDLVVVRVDGDEVFRESGVSSDLRIGLATSFEVTLNHFPAIVTVELPDRGLVGETRVEDEGTLHVGASVLDGEVRFRVSAQPFGYV